MSTLSHLTTAELPFVTQDSSHFSIAKLFLCHLRILPSLAVSSKLGVLVYEAWFTFERFFRPVLETDEI